MIIIDTIQNLYAAFGAEKNLRAHTNVINAKINNLSENKIYKWHVTDTAQINDIILNRISEKKKKWTDLPCGNKRRQYAIHIFKMWQNVLFKQQSKWF